MKLGLTKRTTSADVECVILGRLGFSYDVISRRTGLSKGQIGLRLKQTNSQLRRYRNGESHLAQNVIQASIEDTRDWVAKLRAEVKKLGQPKDNTAS